MLAANTGKNQTKELNSFFPIKDSYVKTRKTFAFGLLLAGNKIYFLVNGQMALVCVEAKFCVVSVHMHTTHKAVVRR